MITANGRSYGELRGIVEKLIIVKLYVAGTKLHDTLPSYLT